jgi:MFS family permease
VGVDREGPRRLPPDAAALVAFSLVVLCVHAVRPAVSYRVLELGGSAATVGISAGAYALLSAALALSMGRRIATNGPTPFLLGGALCVALSAAMAALGASLTVVVASQALLGLGQVAAALSVQSIIAARPVLTRDRGFASLGVAAALGQFVGPGLGGLMQGVAAWPLAVLSPASRGAMTGAFVAVLAVLVAVLGRPSVDDLPAPVVKEAVSPLRGILTAGGVPQALTISIIVLTGIDLVIVYLPLVGEARGLSAAAIGMLLSLRAAGGLASRLVLPLLVDRVSRRALLTSGLGLAGVGMCGVAFLTSVGLLAPALVAIGLGLGIGAPLTMSLLVGCVDQSDRSSVLALRMTGNRIGQLLAPVVAGGLAAAIGAGGIFVLLFGLFGAGSFWIATSRANAS